jgi:HD-like signal output (HDOD) protein
MKPEKGLLTIDWTSEELPTLPAVAKRLITMAVNDQSRVSELCDIIGQDPSIAIKVLRAANSAFYALRMEVTSIRHAIVLLGMSEVRRIALGSVLGERVMTVSQEVRPHAEALWQHLLATAVISQDLTPGGEEDPDLYTLGLLHDIGWLILLAQAPKVFQTLAEEGNRTRQETEKLWGVDHQLWGARLAEKWGLPEPFQIVALRHHEPLEENQPPEYLLRVTLANYLVNYMGLKILSTPEEPITRKVLDWLSLDEDTLNEMKEAAVQERPRIEELWRALSK